MNPHLSNAKRLSACLLLGLAIVLAGCASTKMAALRPAPKNPLAATLKLADWGGPQPSDRTLQFLRVHDLEKDLHGDPQQLLERVQEVVDRSPTAENAYAIAELSYLEARRVQPDNPRLALNFYGAAALHAYRYLFDPRFRDLRNPYDPHFRGACDLYNASLESGLRLVCKERGLVPGQNHTIRTAEGTWDITCVLHGGPWRPEDFGRFEFVSDYQIQGLKNHYQSYGLGVPLIAVRRSYPGEPAATRYYPPGLSYPVTAFLRPVMDEPAGGAAGPRRRGVLELYDPLSTPDIPVADVRAPLESDLTTPLAWFLSNINLESVANAGLLRPDLLLAGRPGGAGPITGLYMVQPYEPGKIPVLLVHGLWSSPMTWMQMFNDLRASPEIRDRCQFWFYLYPTAQPFWISAAQLRRDLAELRQTLDPERREPALDQMVLVGHSMGGLVSRLQAVDSGGDFWALASDKPFDRVRADPEVLRRLQSCFFFEPNPSVRRVITLGTPHRGSSFSNQTTQWLAARLIRLPAMLAQNQQALYRDNRDFFGERSLLRIETSIDSLSPAAPIFPAMLGARRAPWVKYHNVAGVLPKQSFWNSLAGAGMGDGVVDLDSARMTDVASELIVPADHSGVHSHPLAVLEVRRILLEHLAELRFAPVASHLSAADNR